jgi:hypothetical protein
VLSWQLFSIQHKAHKIAANEVRPNHCRKPPPPPPH